MEEHSIYYGKNEFYEIIRNIGGTWNDSKERPIVCLIKLSENDNIYWAIPMGNWEHRDEKAKAITQKYIERSYIGKYTGKPYIIKNKQLLDELIRKTKRILSWENSKPNFYRQHITDIKNYLIEELNDVENKGAVGK